MLTVSETDSRPAVKFCRARCGLQVQICRSCWRNQKYCSEDCSTQTKLARDRGYRRAYRMTPAGRELISEDLEKMKDQDRSLISKYLRQWISKEKLERHSSMTQSKIRTAKFRRIQTVANYDFLHSKTTEKIGKAYLALHAGTARDNLPSAVITGHAGTGKTHLARVLGCSACQKGLSILFLTAAEKVNHLQHAQKTFNPEAELNRYRKLDCGRFFYLARAIFI